MKNERLAIIYALSAVLLWSTVATAFKIALQYHTVLWLLMGASIASTASLTAILLLQNKFLQACKALKTNLKSALLMGTINPVIYYLVLFEAYSRLPAQVAQPVNYTWAITLSLLSVPLLGHKLKLKDGIGLFLGYTGVVVISIAGKSVTGELDAFGLALALFSTLLWALYWILNTKNKQNPIISLFHNFLISLPVLGVLFFFFPQPSLVTSMASIFSLIYVGLFEMGITFVLWQMALRATNNAARIGTFIFLSPFVSLFLINIVLKEPLQINTFAGLGLIILGVWVSQRKKT